MAQISWPVRRLRDRNVFLTETHRLATVGNFYDLPRDENSVELRGQTAAITRVLPVI